MFFPKIDHHRWRRGAALAVGTEEPTKKDRLGITIIVVISIEI